MTDLYIIVHKSSFARTQKRMKYYKDFYRIQENLGEYLWTPPENQMS